MQKRGAGELVINNIDNDGVMQGFDMKLIDSVKRAVSIPVTVIGGAGSLDDMGEVIKQHGIIGVSAGSLLFLKGSIRQFSLITLTLKRKKR